MGYALAGESSRKRYTHRQIGYTAAGLILVGAICYNTVHRNPFARRNMSNSNDKFTWIPVYRKIAEKLLEYRNRQSELIEILNNALSKTNSNMSFKDKMSEHESVPQSEIDPFTFFAFFNRGLGKETRNKMIELIQLALEIEVHMPDDFAGIPVANNLRTQYTYSDYRRKETDIPNLWEIASQIIENGDFHDELFNQCLTIEGVKAGNLTMGLYWLNPKKFLSLDKKNRDFFDSEGIDVPKGKTVLAEHYRKYLKDVQDHYLGKPFYELSREAWLRAQPPTNPPPHKPDSPKPIHTDESNQEIIKSNEPIIAAIQQILKHKRQVILYGPPGTGKTYWANKAAKHLTNGKEHRVVTCTFHPEYGYEHFIEGFKPSLNESNQMIFKLEPGIFKELCKKAGEDKDNDYYLIIDEINRGDIPRIFGELITLIEKDKRGQELTLPHSGKPFSVPENVCIIATMNTADRSIALLDIALRRRFGFLEIMPDADFFTNEAFKNWFKELNDMIVKELDGSKNSDAINRQIGHAYFKKDSTMSNVKSIIQYDIIPLLKEYFYEKPEAFERLNEHLGKVQ